MKKYSDNDYLAFNPFDEGKGDYSIECHKVQIVTIRKQQPCMASYLVPPSYTKHEIAPDSRAWKETAKVDGHFGSCYSCLSCLSALMKLSR